MKRTCFLLLVLLVVGSQRAEGQLRSTNFGTSVLVTADRILVGEPNNSYRPGTVYVYAKNGDGIWRDTDRLTASNAAFYDGFGSSLAASQDRLVVAALRQNDGRGGAYVFERRDQSWSEAARLVAPEATTEEKLGTAVAIEGDLIAIGAPATTRYGRLTPSTKPGAVYLFRWDPDSERWSEEVRLQGSDAQVGATFGAAVAISDGRIFVGAPRQDGRTGAVYVFEHSGEEWAEAQMLTSELLGGRPAFGSSLAIRNGALYVGAPLHNGGVGAISVLRQNAASGSWSEERIVTPSDEPAAAYFGAALAFSGETLLAGSPTAASARGALYEYDPQTNQSERIDPRDANDASYFGYAVSALGDVAVAAVPQGEGLEGVAAVLERIGGEWAVRATLRGEDAGLDPITGTEEICRDGKAALFDCDRVDLLSFLPVRNLGGGRGTEMNDLWGWTDEETGREYVIAGRTDGTAFVDITHPTNPVYLGDLPLTSGAQPTVWRDMKVYDNHAFIVADGTRNHGMQVFDLRRLRDVSEPPVRFTETAIYEGLHNAHNVAINEETGFAYAVGSDRCGGGLHMVDIRDPQNPTFAGCFTHHEAGGGSTHDTQCVVYRGPDESYQGHEICLSSNGSSFSIADVTDKEQPAGISATSFPNHAYIHQGWLTDDHRYFFMNDELDEYVGNVDETRTLIWDVSDLDDPQLVKEYFFGSTSADHNLYIDGNYMYQSNYLSGLHVHDVSDPEQPRQIAHFDTVPVGENSARLDGSWSNYPYFESGVVPVSSKEEGLFLLRVRRETGL